MCVCVVKVCDLLDLLSGPDEPSLPGSTLGPGGAPLGPAGLMSGSAGGDLLDLLGGLELTPTPTPATGRGSDYRWHRTRAAQARRTQ